MSIPARNIPIINYSDRTGLVSRSWYEWLTGLAVSVRDFGAVGDGVTDDTVAIRAAINTGSPVMFPGGLTYLAHELTQSTNGQVLFSDGIAIVKKNANGVLLTCSGTEVQLRNLAFRGDAASPVYTGDNINASGNNFSMINCSSQWAYAYAVKATGGHTVIEGTTGGVYQTTDATGSGYDIVLGVSGTATLYHKIDKVYTSQATGGIRFIDTGGTSVSNSVFGKISIESGTSPAGVGGGMWNSNRILGDVTVSLSSSAWASNQFSNITLTFSGGTSGHALDGSNVFSGTATITDSSVGSFIVDIRTAVPTAYTPVWTGSISNPDIGDGSIVGRYLKVGRQVSVTIRVIMGATTTYGSGNFRFSLPFAPTSTLPWNGSASVVDSGTATYLGVTRTLQSGANIEIWGDNLPGTFTSLRPMTWATNDELCMTIIYTT